MNKIKELSNKLVELVDGITEKVDNEEIKTLKEWDAETILLNKKIRLWQVECLKKIEIIENSKKKSYDNKN